MMNLKNFPFIALPLCPAEINLLPFKNLKFIYYFIEFYKWQIVSKIIGIRQVRFLASQVLFVGSVYPFSSPHQLRLAACVDSTAHHAAFLARHRCHHPVSHRHP